MGQWNGQGQPLGFVVSVTGQVSGICVSRNLDVEEVPLEVGDAIYGWDQLQTGPESSLVVRFEDGSQWSLGPHAQVEVDPTQLGEDQAEEPIALALEEGIDFNALEPTASGGGTANDDGTRVIILDRGNESDPYQAFETPGIDTEGTELVLDFGDVIQPEDAVLVAFEDSGEPEVIDEGLLKVVELDNPPRETSGGKFQLQFQQLSDGGSSSDPAVTKTFNIVQFDETAG